MAINLLSPGIKITEADLTASVTATGSTVGGTAGQFVWGPANEPTLVGSESELGAVFGKPSSNADVVVDFLSAANFLAYSPNLYVVRAIDDAARNAGNTGSVVLVENLDDYESTTFAANNGPWIAKYPGEIGNSLKVSVCGNSAAFSAWSEGNTVFDNAPGTSPWAIAKGFATANDEVHIVVIDEDGKFSGVSGTVLEKFPALSKASDARGADGGSNYYKNVINTKSKYIWWANKSDTDWDRAANTTAFATPAVANKSLADGTDGTGASVGDYTTAYQKFANKQNVTISVLPVGQANTTVINAAIAVAEGRKDTMVCFSPERSDVVGATSPTATIAFAADVTRSTYAIMDANWKYQYDKYNDAYVYVPCAADVAGCLARVDDTRAPWFSPAGYTNGRILNAVKLAWNPTQAQRDELYKKGINPIFTQPGRGTVLFGDKTFVTTTGSFSRINVRRLFIQIEAAIEGLAGDILFEQNDAATRERFVNAVTPYLRTVQGGRGIEEFRVVCDTTNNTDDIVTSNGFVADIFVRPIGSINFIQLNFVSVAGAAAFAALG